MESLILESNNDLELFIHKAESSYQVLGEAVGMGRRIKFQGTYRQCLIYCGAISLGKSSKEAEMFASQ